MAPPSPFSLPRSEFNEFLFARVGEEENGMPLSVVSALARLDLDPWKEAARLSDLPKELAAAALDGLIRRLPAGCWQLSDSQTIAARLIELLPRRGPVAQPGQTKPGGRDKASLATVMAWLIILALGAATLFHMAN